MTLYLIQLPCPADYGGADYGTALYNQKINAHKNLVVIQINEQRFKHDMMKASVESCS